MIRKLDAWDGEWLGAPCEPPSAEEEEEPPAEEQSEPALMGPTLPEKVREGEIDLLDAELALSDTSELMNLIKAA